VIEETGLEILLVDSRNMPNIETIIGRRATIAFPIGIDLCLDPKTKRIPMASQARTPVPCNG
jgi:hypothetical protein